METKTTLGEIATVRPEAIKVFLRHGLDFCCGGRKDFGQACGEKGLHAEAILTEIASEEMRLEERERGKARLDGLPLEALANHIVVHYHNPLRTELPRLIQLAEKLERVHGEKEECPRGLSTHLHHIKNEVESHLAKEEEILFPLICAGRGGMAHMPITVMLKEHDEHGENLRRTREMTGNFALPEAACATWRELYRSLETLEADLMEHIHIENNILFPRALAQ